MQIFFEVTVKFDGNGRRLDELFVLRKVTLSELKVVLSIRIGLCFPSELECTDARVGSHGCSGNRPGFGIGYETENTPGIPNPRFNRI